MSIAAATPKLTIDQILPHGKQAWSITEATARLNLWVGAVRSGKTYSTIWRWIEYVRDGPHGPLVMIGKTERTLKRNVLDPIAELLGKRWFRLVAGSGECFIFGRRIYLAGANDERSKDKIQGLTAAGALGDEVTTWPESFFTMLLSRLSVTGAKFFGTLNPDAPAHWLKKKFIDRASDLDMRVFHFMLPDNPALDPAYVEALKKEYVGLWYRRYILGLWALAEGAVYDMFDPDRHVRDDLPRNEDGDLLIVRHWGGGDYGTGNPTVYLALSQIKDDKPERSYMFHDEWRWDSEAEGRQKTDAEYSAAFQGWALGLHQNYGLARWPSTTWIDPSASSFRLQLQRDNVPGVVPANNAVLDGIRNVSRLIGADRLSFHRGTTEATVDEFMGYHWDAAAQKRGEDKPVKENDHGPDTARYVVMGVESGTVKHLPSIWE